MKEKAIFSNFVTLVFKNQEMESLYRKNINSPLRTRILLFFLFLIQIINVSLIYALLNFSLFVSNIEKNIEKVNEINKIKNYILALSIIPFLSIFAYYLKSVYPKVSFLFNYTIYLFYLSITNSTNREIMIWINAINREYHYLNFTLIFFFTFFYVILYECQFLKIFISNIIMILLNLLISTSFSNIKLCLLISKFAFLFFIYSVERNIRKSFYYNIKLERKCKFLDSILNNMQSGVFVNEIEEIKFMNVYGKENLSFLFNSTFKRRESVSVLSRIDEFSINFSSEGVNKFNKNIIREDIFANLLDINPELSSKYSEIFSKMSYKDVCQFLINNEFFQNDFKYLGKKEFKENGTFRYLEIHLRITQKNLKKYIEFIFHDVTKMKEIEETRIQSKYQSMFLSKVAHEFKNPLIGVMSLIDEIRENKIKGGVKKNLGFIENLCMYMVLLVKDFEIISEINITKNILIDPSMFNLRDEMEKIKNITLTLIETLSKSHLNKISFNLEISEDTPLTINFDKNRLNQIILNLLTNSIKFTQKGYITLRISTEIINFEKKITFYVIDSGIGITDETQRVLFNRFVKNELMNNNFGQGLGLYLVETLCSKLGSKIQYRNNTPEGSVFYFTIDNPQSINESEETFLIEKYNPLKPDNESILLSHSLNSASISINIQEDKSKNISKSFGLEILNKLEKESKTVEDQLRMPTISQYENNNTTMVIDERQIIRIIVVDDDNFVRNSTIRVINKYFENSFNLYKLDILEASDGIECLNIIYTSTILNKIITFIIMDETMRFMNGSFCSDIINQMYVNNCFKKIPIFIVTAFEHSTSKNKFNTKFLDKVYSKPFTNQMLKEILSSLKLEVYKV